MYPALALGGRYRRQGTNSTANRFKNSVTIIIFPFVLILTSLSETQALQSPRLSECEWPAGSLWLRCRTPAASEYSGLVLGEHKQFSVFIITDKHGGGEHVSCNQLASILILSFPLPMTVESPLTSECLSFLISESDGGLSVLVVIYKVLITVSGT